MIDIMDVALYLLMQDTEDQFNKDKIFAYKGKEYIEGNVRLNIFLFMARAMYISKTGEPMFEDNFEAWEVGTICPKVYEHYNELLDKRDKLREDFMGPRCKAHAGYKN